LIIQQQGFLLQGTEVAKPLKTITERIKGKEGRIRKKYYQQ